MPCSWLGKHITVQGMKAGLVSILHHMYMACLAFLWRHSKLLVRWMLPARGGGLTIVSAAHDMHLTARHTASMAYCLTCEPHSGTGVVPDMPLAWSQPAVQHLSVYLPCCLGVQQHHAHHCDVQDGRCDLSVVCLTSCHRPLHCWYSLCIVSMEAKLLPWGVQADCWSHGRRGAGDYCTK
jgi:hypothetical protein